MSIIVEIKVLQKIMNEAKRAKKYFFKGAANLRAKNTIKNKLGINAGCSDSTIGFEPLLFDRPLR